MTIWRPVSALTEMMRLFPRLSTLHPYNCSAVHTRHQYLSPQLAHPRTHGSWQVYSHSCLRSKRQAVANNNHATMMGKLCLLKNGTDQLVLRLDWNDVVALLSHVLAELNLLPSQLILACTKSNHSWHKPRHLTTALQKQAMTYCNTAYFQHVQNVCMNKYECLTSSSSVLLG